VRFTVRSRELLRNHKNIRDKEGWERERKREGREKKRKKEREDCERATTSIGRMDRENSGGFMASNIRLIMRHRCDAAW